MHLLPPPPKPVKYKPMIFVDYAWQEQTPNVQEIPVPPPPRKGYRETLIEGTWVYVKRDLNVTI